MNFINLASNAVLNYTEAQGYEQNQLNIIDSFLQSTVKGIESNPSDTPLPTPNSSPTPTPIPEETMPIIPPASDKAGIAVDYVPKEGTYKKELVNNYSGNTYCNYDFTTDMNTDWLVWSLTDDAIYLICKGSPLKGGQKLENYQYTYSWENGIVRLTGYRRI